MGEVTLEAESVRFGSPGDEDSFFRWLSSLSCVREVVGRGRVLSLEVDLDAGDSDQLRELIAIFHRYDVDMAQLAALDREGFSAWFRPRSAYWYDAVFGTK